MSPSKRLLSTVESLESRMVETLSECVRRNAIGPKSGGPGEWKKAEYLEGLISKWGFTDIKHYDAPDDSVPEGTRPNIVATIKGRTPRNLLIIGHLDVVPEGDLKRWDTPPFEPVVKEGKVFGRGTEDNGQGVIAALYAAKALLDAGVQPEYTLRVLLASDEETGSEKGIKYLLQSHPDLFRADDLIVVPDGGIEDGRMMEVSEKTILWLRAVTEGRQCHGSTPEKGLNAHRAAARFVVRADALLHERFPKNDPMFNPPVSTFEPTKKEGNVPNINTVPGEDVVYFDNRILPLYKPEDIMAAYREAADSVGKETGARIRLETVMLDAAAPPTPPDSDVVKRLGEAIRAVTGKVPYPAGIGGGTYAAMFRRKGIPAVVWCTAPMTAHSYNEYAIIKNIVTDAKVFAVLAAGTATAASL